MNRIGPQMARAIKIVSANPGCSKLTVARRIAPYGTGIQFGYRAVDRAIRAGEIVAKRLSNRFALTVPSCT